ncbi:glycosyltransferase family 2 protein [Corallibacter sp.]|uniref:glycosyltransferase family 2 protein n=1 Tax=Corallibacter sp. TaxID=2038084 RepID=UPI003AB44816
MVNNIKVSVVCTAFNHERFIAQAIDSFLEQQCDFAYEIIIHEDCSTDGTKAIIEAYEKKYPDIIKPIYQPVNIYSKGEKPWVYCFKKAQGDYIALCDGDDYWIDPYKLQKQVDFLEANDDYFFVSANSQFLKNNQLEETKIVGDLVLQDFINGNKLGRQAAAFMFRNKQVTRFLDDLKAYPWPFGDLLLIFWCLKQGKGMVLEEVMVYYRIHDTGLWSSITMKSRLQNMIMFYTLAYKSEIHPNYNFDLYKLSVDSVLNKVFESNKTIRAEQSSNGVLKALKKLLKEVFNYG